MAMIPQDQHVMVYAGITKREEEPSLPGYVTTRENRVHHGTFILALFKKHIFRRYF